MLLQTYKMNNANADNISSGLCFRILFQNKDISYIFCIHPHTLCNLADRSYGLKLNCGQLQTRSNCFSCQKTPWKLISFLSLLLYPAARCLMKLTALQYIKCTNLLLHTVCCHHCWSLEFPCSGYMDKVQSTFFYSKGQKYVLIWRGKGNQSSGSKEKLKTNIIPGFFFVQHCTSAVALLDYACPSQIFTHKNMTRK